MNIFHYQENELYAEQIPLTQIAKKFGTPCYVYSRASIEQQWWNFEHAFISHPHHIYYAVKANSNLAILNLLASLGSGFDIVSGGELTRVLAAGGKAEKIVFSGVGKQIHEIEQALTADIFCFNVESSDELTRLDAIAAKQKKRAPIALRINPNIDVATHPYIATGLKESKFGIAYEDALDLYLHASKLKHIKIIGIACHIGSQITATAPFTEALQRTLELVTELKNHGIHLQHLDLGGGLGVSYHAEAVPTFDEYAAAILPQLKNSSLELMLEPGRAIVADAGILLTTVEYLKHSPAKNFAIVDAAMNDLLRPALYDAWHGILPVQRNTEMRQLYDIVGPVCESGDFLGKNHHLALKAGDLLAICSVGAYGFVMSSNYNSRPRSAEVLVDQDHVHLIREREKITDLFAQEKMIPSGKTKR